MNTQQQQKGFTIIEVVLVLAIAALIFLMIFVALPALQRGQRDTARKNDASAMASAINTYRSNHRGSLSGMTAADVTSNISQIDSGSVTIRAGAGNGPAANLLDGAVIYTGAQCNPGGSAAVATSSTKSAAVVIRLEGSNNTTICTDS